MIRRTAAKSEDSKLLDRRERDVTGHLLMALGPTLLSVFALAYPDLALHPSIIPFSPDGTIKVNNAGVATWNSGQRLVWWRVPPTGNHVHHERSILVLQSRHPG
jgi:hypothetical protein